MADDLRPRLIAALRRLTITCPYREKPVFHGINDWRPGICCWYCDAPADVTLSPADGSQQWTFPHTPDCTFRQAIDVLAEVTRA